MSDFVLPISGEMSVGATLNGEVSIGSVIFNDYIITISDINGGHRLTARRGSDIQTMDILNGVDAPVPDIKITDVVHGHDVTITVGDVAKTFYIHDGVDGRDGVDGKDGYTPVKGKDYFDGQPGKDGRDGVDGKNGVDGKTPVKGVDYFDGKDGYTPVKGKDYFDGQPGKDGISPVINVTDIENGHRVTITTGNDVQSFDVLNGKDGEDAEGGTVEVDPTLTIEGMAADAKATGDAVAPIAAITDTTTTNKIEWDGVVGDKVTGEMMVGGIMAIPLVRVSDYVPDVSVFTEQGITIGGTFEGNTGEEPIDAEEVESSIIHAENCYTMELFTVALDDNVVAHIQTDVDSTITLPKKGVYFIQDNEVMSMRSLSSPLLEVPSYKVKPEALPESVQVQSDYAQHDATQSDYIRNRPFWPEWSPVLVCTDDYGHYGTNDNGRTRIEINFDSVPGVVAPMEGKRYTFGFAAQTYSGIATRGVYAWGDNLQLDGIGIVAEQDAGVYAFYRARTDEERVWYVVLPESDYDHADNFELFAIIEGNGFYNKLSAADDKLDMTGVPEGVSIVYDLTKLYNAANSGDVKSGDMYAALQNDVEITVDMNGAEITLTSADLVFAPDQNMMGFECDLYIYGGQVPLAGIVHDGDYRSLALLDLNALGMAQITTKSIKVNYPGIFAPTIAAKKVPVECLPGALVVYTPILGQAFAFADYEGTINITCADIRDALRSGSQIYVRVVADIDAESAAKGYGEYYSVMRIEFFESDTGSDAAMLMYEHKNGTRGYCEAMD